MGSSWVSEGFIVLHWLSIPKWNELGYYIIYVFLLYYVKKIQYVKQLFNQGIPVSFLNFLYPSNSTLILQTEVLF